MLTYQSTRSGFTASPAQAILQGLAPDGGLFIDPTLGARPFDWQGCLKKDWLSMAAMILSHLLPDIEGMEELVRQAYLGKFEGEDLTPLVPVGEDFVLELFRGPTAAFKDVALSMLPRLLSAAKRQSGIKEEIVILTATSGDTGKAALHGFRDVEGVRILVFYPDGGVSPIQQLQMTTPEGKNVGVCAVRGNFDDCQRAVKEAFARGQEIPGVRLSSANSINIGRLAPQIVYYFDAYKNLVASGGVKPGDPVDFSVPTGNFGDILAGYFAKLMGLPVGTLICASNANRVLTDFLETGVYDKRRPFLKTSSPSMDILVSSNLERLLFLALDCDPEKTARCMTALREDGIYTLEPEAMRRIRDTFAACCCDEAATGDVIGAVWREHRYLLDPHTAVAFHAAAAYKKSGAPRRPLVILATASPYKFPDPVLSALGQQAPGDAFERMAALEKMTGVPMPRHLAELRGKPVLHRDVIDRDAIVPYVITKLRAKEK